MDYQLKFKSFSKKKVINNKDLYLDNKTSINLPNIVRRLTVIKSPHINEQSKEQFEKRIYTTLFKRINKDLNINQIKTLLLNKTTSGFNSQINVTERLNKKA
jgi:ribosomal protein S10